jgi:hypothetical protein
MRNILYIVLFICLVVALSTTSCKAKKDLNAKYLDGYYCDFGGKDNIYRIQFGKVKK